MHTYIFIHTYIYLFVHIYISTPSQASMTTQVCKTSTIYLFTYMIIPALLCSTVRSRVVRHRLWMGQTNRTTSLPRRAAGFLCRADDWLEADSVRGVGVCLRRNRGDPLRKFVVDLGSTDEEEEGLVPKIVNLCGMRL